MITVLGRHAGYSIVVQDIEGVATMHTVAQHGAGQWDEIVLIGCRTLDDAKATIDAALAADAETEADDVPVDWELAASLLRGV